MTKSTDSTVLGAIKTKIRKAALPLLTAPLIISCLVAGLTAGCGPQSTPEADPNDPPEASSIFSPASGNFLGNAPGVVILNDEQLMSRPNLALNIEGDPVVCYSWDGSEPGYTYLDGFGGFCAGGQGSDITSIVSGEGFAKVLCKNDEDGDAIAKTLKIIYYWDFNDGNGYVPITAEANYTVSCQPPSQKAQYFRITGAGVVSGFVTGTTDVISGSAQLNDEYDIENGKAQIFGSNLLLTTTNQAIMNIWSSFEIRGDWAWNDPSEDPDPALGGILSNLESTAWVTGCEDLWWKLKRGCSGVTMDDPNANPPTPRDPLGITNAQIVLNLAVNGDETTYHTEVSVKVFASKYVDTSNDFTLTKIPKP